MSDKQVKSELGLNNRETAIMNEAFMIGRTYSNCGEKETPGEIHTKLVKKCILKANAIDNRHGESSPLVGIVSLLKDRKEEINKLWTKSFDDRDMDAESTYKELFNSYCNVIGDLINE